MSGQWRPGQKEAVIARAKARGMIRDEPLIAIVRERQQGASASGGGGLVVDTPKRATGRLSERKTKNETDPHGEIPHPKPQRDKAPALERADAGEKEGIRRTRIRFIGYRVRPLDPDNFAGSCKDLLDGLRHAALIPGDEPWRIIFETEQVRVKSYQQERTEIEIDL